MSLLNEQIALDTNEYIFGLRRVRGYIACTVLLFEKLPELSLYVPAQVLAELRQNLVEDEMTDIYIALDKAKSVQIDYSPVVSELVQTWEAKGAKKGDAVIAAKLDEAGISLLVSENRHFLSEISDLPFSVLSAQQFLNISAD